ncbi:SMP-30/gluconolactonase/LRE family protein [Paraburkholderia youngii]|uniref:SMP-30/gluconolactonase/LRE family protein n=1 Tax=Paraburkholderia youngii TaxID=2782701 RepID=A0A7Y6N339_9BURK|nr:SMP-30/gluconolactonase/LRE family protein [Paraburkholderia youngii]NUY05687.1 SMP-30/gluconolactonase/LRE family protein [Paraburkholderia youngii]
MSIAIEAHALQRIGADLVRPESVVLGRDRRLFCSNGTGGISCIGPDGTVSKWGHQDGLVPNGIAALQNDEFLIANVGVEGGVWHLDSERQVRRLAIQVDGRPLREVNFVYVDDLGRVWLSISSSGAPDPVFRLCANEGFIVLGDRTGFRIVARGLGWSNEIRVSPSGEHLFVNETFGRRLLRFDVAADGSLSHRQVLATFGIGDYPDGMALDADGGVWVVSIISNRLYRVAAGRSELMFEDCDPGTVNGLEEVLKGRGLKRSDLHGLRTGKYVSNISSIAFDGEDGHIAYLGSLGDTCLWRFESPVKGSPLHPARELRISLP